MVESGVESEATNRSQSEVGYGHIRRIVNIKTLIAATAFSALALFPTGLMASTVTWNIWGQQMTGGASVNGSFQYDADTNTYSNVDITVSQDNTPLYYNGIVPADTYTTSMIAGDSNSTELDLHDGTAYWFQLYFESGLTDSGGTQATGFHLLNGAGLADVEAPGTIPYNAEVTTDTPEPATGLLSFLAVGAGLVFAGRRKALGRA